MPKIYKINAEEVEQIKEVRKSIRYKKVDKRFYAVQLRGEGLSNVEIAEKLDTSDKVVSQWVSKYKKGGIEALYAKKRVGNRRNLSYEEEAELLSKFFKKAEKGEIVEVSEIRNAYIEKVGHRIGNGQIYYVLKRHNWRKLMPRSKHPKKASNEAIEASKKLNHLQLKYLKFSTIRQLD